MRDGEGAPRLALGTVQWGLPYGIANTSGQADRTSVRAILDLASRVGIEVLDTARAYGQSEAEIGAILTSAERSRFRIVTKLSPSIGGPGIAADDAVAQAKRSLDESRNALGIDRIDTLLLHRAAQREAYEGRIWAWLRHARAEGTIGRLGISAANPDEAMAALESEEVETIQVAASLLDRRLMQRGFFDKARRLGKEVHVRSIYLQGAAFLDPARLPPALSGARADLERIAAFAREHGSAPFELWLAYARTLPARYILIGAERPEQLDAAVRSYEKTAHLSPELAVGQLSELGDETLDPSLWNRS